VDRGSPNENRVIAAQRVPRPLSLLEGFVVLFIASVAVNFPWELAQSPLYEWSGASRNVWWHCFVASVGDGVLVLMIFGAGWLVFGRAGWFSSPGPQHYLLTLSVGLFIAIGVEWIAVHTLHRWTYTPQMPLIPGLDIGLVPIAQMLMLPALIFNLVTRFTQYFR
jgi:hypothetical protein